jgi:hypothetical protein
MSFGRFKKLCLLHLFEQSLATAAATLDNRLFPYVAHHIDQSVDRSLLLNSGTVREVLHVQNMDLTTDITRYENVSENEGGEV